LGSEGSTNPLREILEEMSKERRAAHAEGSAYRRQVLVDLARLWRLNPEHRFGQAVIQALGVAFGAPADVDLSVYDDAQMQIAFKKRSGDYAGREPRLLDGPFWDTETATGRNFMNGLPRDPARIKPFLTTLSRAWDQHPDLMLGALIAKAAAGSRVGQIEDGLLRRNFERLSGTE
jgi:hypothetical protein